MNEFSDHRDLLFSSINAQAIAAAFMAQSRVHLAILSDGQVVVSKVLKPGHHQLIEEDIALAESLAQFIGQYFFNFNYSPVAVARPPIGSGGYFPKVFWEAAT
jgi:predicted unusual protein kinase regulating ubiquinone biosynthesis (AarF/ABC1/UbiB family)